MSFNMDAIFQRAVADFAPLCFTGLCLYQLRRKLWKIRLATKKKCQLLRSAVNSRSHH